MLGGRFTPSVGRGCRPTIMMVASSSDHHRSPRSFETIMKRLLILCSLVIPMLLSDQSNADDSHQYYDVRSYVLGDAGDAKAIDQYLEKALLPALKRQGIGPVGVFANSPDDESGSSRLIVVVPYASADQIASTNAKVMSDPQYLADAKTYFDRASNNPAYQRIGFATQYVHRVEGIELLHTEG